MKQLSDIIGMADITSNNQACITSGFAGLSESELNAELYKILVTNNALFTIEYLGNRLDKILSPLYERLLDYYEDIEDTNSDLCNIIKSKFLFNWNKLADSLFADYNPINNYDMTEDKTIKRKTDMKVSTSSNTDSESSESNNSTVSNTGSVSSNDNETQKYAGFNSDSPQVATETNRNGSQSETRSGTQSETKSGSGYESHSGSNETTGALTDNVEEESLNRSGNIGVTTSQQMIQSEIELRKHNLIDIIFNDMDSILFLDYYS